MLETTQLNHAELVGKHSQHAVVSVIDAVVMVDSVMTYIKFNITHPHIEHPLHILRHVQALYYDECNSHNTYFITTTMTNSRYYSPFCMSSAIII